MSTRPGRPSIPAAAASQTVVNPITGEVSSFNPAALTVRYPSLMDLDELLQRKIRINEPMGITLRFEALNALNAVVFGAPDVGVTDTNFGYNPHAQANNPHIAQVSARFTC